MFQLELYDRKGNQLHEGDIVKISDGTKFSFYAEVKYLKDEGVIAPFSTFSFHSFEKVKSVPNGAVKSDETRYGIWFMKSENKDKNAEDFKRYLISWRECEIPIQERCYRISIKKSVKQPQLF
jgi:hypothetical protein